jgi:hypothetical protein
MYSLVKVHIKNEYRGIVPNLPYVAPHASLVKLQHAF